MPLEPLFGDGGGSGGGGGGSANLSELYYAPGNIRWGGIAYGTLEKGSANFFDLFVPVKKIVRAVSGISRFAFNFHLNGKTYSRDSPDNDGVHSNETTLLGVDASGLGVLSVSFSVDGNLRSTDNVEATNIQDCYLIGKVFFNFTVSS